MLGWLLKKLKKNKKAEKIISESIFNKELKQSFLKNNLNTEFVKTLEETLIKADIGIKETKNIISDINQENFDKNISLEQIKEFLQNKITSNLEEYQQKLEITKTPYVILFNGVNGSGKTTSIGKIAHQLSQQGKKILIVAGDTYRAAAATQLKAWSNKVGCNILQAEKEGADPAALAYKALKLAQDKNYDIVLIDTAGRLQNQKNLMDQLEKISRVLKKLDESAPHLSLLVVDGTTGQNALRQLETFKESSYINGLIITKLDGTAKGGVIIPMLKQHQIPVYFIGTGEKINDLKEFDIKKFVNGLII